LSKNLGFVAVGAFGLVATFFVQFAQRREREAMPVFRKTIYWCVAVWLMMAHTVGAVAARAGLGFVTPYIAAGLDWQAANLPDGADRDVVVVNDPGPVYAMIPIYCAYRGQRLPTSVKNLALGLTGFRITRSTENTVVVTSSGDNLFVVPNLGPVHTAYALQRVNEFLFNKTKWKSGDRVVRKGWTIDILETSASDEPRSVAIHFDSPLESNNRLWLQFVWQSREYVPFVLPQVGESVDIPGPRGPLAK
jgi:hypothetical protein